MASPEFIAFIDLTISLLFWLLLALFIGSNAFWFAEALWAWRRYASPPPVYGPADVQVRILTIDAEAVVQATVDSLPESITDRHVIAEAPMRIDGATVHVVPDGFECDARRKARALEWARRAIPCETEFVLFLDEDTVVREFDGLPDADIVQFREEPQRTGSLVSYLSEMYRLGFQYEQLAFSRFSFPLYTWGGGLAIRKDLEDAVTWDRDTVIEDTKFVWQAGLLREIEFAVISTRFENQAPPSFAAMVKQRRRWMAGSREEHRMLPPRYFLLTGVRDLAWAVSPLVPLVFLLPHLVPNVILFQTAFRWLTVVFFGFVFVWCLMGIRYYDADVRDGLLLIVASPVIVIPHAIGALYGLVSHPSPFSVTEKVVPPGHARSEPATTPTASAGDRHAAVLVVGPKTAVDSRAWLANLTASTSVPSRTLIFAFAESPAAWIEQCMEVVTDRGGSVDVVRVGDPPATDAGDPPAWCDVVARIDEPADPLAIISTMELYLAEHDDAAVWFDSLSDLLETTEPHTVHGMVGVITELIRETNSTVHFHVDPSRSSPSMLRLLSRVVDRVVDAESDAVLEPPRRGVPYGDAAAPKPTVAP